MALAPPGPRPRSLGLLGLLLLALGCVHEVDLTPKAPGAPKPGGSPEPQGCALDGGVCPGLSPTCSREKEACTSADTCCSGRCELKGAEPGTCKLLPSCHVSYETCAQGHDCCSGLCLLSESAGGRCEPASGCASVGERCATSTQCCSGVCKESPEGVLRCAGAKCKALGETCAKSDECCDKDAGSCRAGVGAGLRCLGAPGSLSVCLAQGEACMVPEQCCAGTCMAAGTGALACTALATDAGPDPIP